jgi:glucose/arabinose dehydrogenase
MPVRHAAALIAIALAVTISLAACGGDDPSAGSAPSPDPSAEPTTAAAPDTSPTPSPEPTAGSPEPDPQPEPTSTFAGVAASGVPQPGQASDVVTGLDVPWDLAFLPDGSALVTLRDLARVLRVSADGSTAPVTADGDDGRVAGVAPDGEGGLLGITTDATAEHVFVYVSAADENRVVRYDWDAAANTLASPTTVVAGIPRSEVHNGGRIDLGPDGFLYVATGDARDTGASPQPGSLAGKILRVTTEGEAAPGNPIAGSPVWSLGHRNVQGLGWSEDGTLWASEFGQNTTDELNVIEGGTDYGWPRVEGVGDVEGLRDPVATWSPDQASPSGVAVADDAVYLAALRGQRLWRVPIADGRVAGEPEAYLTGELGRLRHVEVAPDGSLWLLTSNTFRGDPREGDDRIVRLPLG